MGDNLIKIMIDYIKLTVHVVKLNILSAMEYRVVFWTQVIGMAINDFGWLLTWSLFFMRFPNFNGWVLQDTMLLFAISMVNFAIFRIFAGNTEEISHDINHGHLDYYMSLPKNVLWQISTSRTNISAIGDLTFGLILFLFLGLNWTQFLVFGFLTIITALIMYNFTVILHSLSFYVGNFEETSDRIFGLLAGLTLYPATAFSGALKVITFTIIPVFFIAWLPVSIIKDFSWIHLGYIGIFWLVTLIFAVWFFNRGLRRYESGNMINVRM